MDVIIKILVFVQNFCVVLICAELFFCRYLKRRSMFALRMLLVPLFMFIFCKESAPIMPWAYYGSFTHIAFLILGEFFNLSFVIMFAISVAIMCFCFDASPWKIMSLCAMGYVLQNAQYHITEMFRYTLFGNETESLGYCAAAIGVITLCFAVSYLIPVKMYSRYTNPDTLFSCGYTFIVLMIVIGVSYLIFVLDRYNVVYHAYALVSCLLLIFVRMSEFAKLKSDDEKDKLEKMLHEGKMLREFYWVNAEEMNRKCHDLKRAIDGLRNMSVGSERDKYITDVQCAVETYDTRIKTGCETADIALTEKSMQCVANGIALSCLVDGGALEMFNALDLYVFLCNALDNAIEAELLEQKENRNISVSVRRRGNMTHIIIENYFSGQLQMKGLTPETTKKDRTAHGYGIGSMRSILEKYGGFLNVYCEGHRFVLFALVPSGN